MSAADLAGLVAIGIAAGMASGLVGVGGGVLMVPGLVVFLDESQLHAEATALVAIVAVAGIGAVRQRGYGNVRLREGLVLGALSPLGAAAGAILANAAPERALEIAFAAVQLYFAYRLARRALREPSVQPR